MNTSNDAGKSIPLANAARALGISREAVRQRIRRGSIAAHKVDDRWYVAANDIGPSEMLMGSASVTATNVETDDQQLALVIALKEEIVFLRHSVEEQMAALRRKDETIAALTERLMAFVASQQAGSRDAHP